MTSNPARLILVYEDGTEEVWEHDPEAPAQPVHRPWWSSDGGRTFTGWRALADGVEKWLEERATASSEDRDA